ncbi:MAG: MBOAT family protein, partial [Butyrivibrio sp.]|nr:MBOAT family protein [Butyrivibrio sp.]
MLFTSYSFILFVFIVFCLYYLLPPKWQWLVLLLASYVFYFFAGRTFLIYILVTTVSTYYAAVGIQDKRQAFEEYFEANKKSLDKEAKKEL